MTWWWRLRWWFNAPVSTWWTRHAGHEPTRATALGELALLVAGMILGVVGLAVSLYTGHTWLRLYLAAYGALGVSTLTAWSIVEAALPNRRAETDWWISLRHYDPTEADGQGPSEN